MRGLIADDTRGGIWLIMQDETPVGYLALCTGYSIEFGGDDAFIDEFYIEPESRGMGLGGVTLELIKAEAKTLGIRALHLEVARTNTRAQRLYAKADFRPRDKYVLMSIEL